MNCFDRFIRAYSLFLDKYYWIILILTPVFVVLCAALSFAIPGVSPDMPDFSKPTEGFEPRGTFLMKRVVTFQNTLNDAIKHKDLTCPSTRKKRASFSAMSSPQLKCTGYDLDYNSHSKLVFESGKNMMNRDSIIATCRLEERLFNRHVTVPFDYLCLHDYNDETCCPSISLGSFIAQINNRSSCFEITDEDVSQMATLLQDCSSLYFAGKLSRDKPVPCSRNDTQCGICKKFDEMLDIVFKFLVDQDYTQRTNILKTTMVLTLMYRPQYSYFKDIYDNKIAPDFPLKDSGVKLVAFEFTDFKYDLFSDKLIQDVVFPGIGLVCIALILLVYTHSLLIMFLTIFSVISSLVISYFIYHFVFRLTFFPFLNVTTLIFVIGIGADDAFIFNDVWNQAKVMTGSQGSRVSWMEYTLKHAIVSMFVTSLTTSAAFYANVVSNITAIKLFGIFAGTTILINYSFMLTWFPAGIVALDRCMVNGCCNSKAGNGHREDMVLRGVNQEPPNDEDSHGHGTAPGAVEGGSDKDNKEIQASTSSFNNDQQGRSTCALCRGYELLRSKCSQFIDCVFIKFIPKCLKLYPLWLLILVALGVGMLCAIIVSPGLNRPKSDDFQVFSSSHPLEQYNLKYKQKFRFGSKSTGNYWFYIIFGIKPEDNGNYLVPKDFGHLVYDTSFDIIPAENQKWLINLCSKIRNQSFFGDVTGSWKCFLEEFRDNCLQYNSNTTFPFTEHDLQQCLSSGHHSCYQDYTSPYLFGRNSTKIKILTLAFPTNVPYTNEYKIVEQLWSEVKDFTSNVFQNAPQDLQGGWSVSYLRFFALQDDLGTSTLSSLALSIGIAFAVILMSSLNWVISIYAILTILFILSTTVGSLVLNGWELNILESIVISVAVGLSVDFTLHYGVAYSLSPDKGRHGQVKFALSHIGPAVTLASITTFIAGVFMMFSSVLVYFQMGQFLTLVMAVSWVYATFLFLSLCYFIGPVGHFGQLNSTRCCSCKVSPAASRAIDNQNTMVNDHHM